MKKLHTTVTRGAPNFQGDILVTSRGVQQTTEIKKTDEREIWGDNFLALSCGYREGHAVAQTNPLPLGFNCFRHVRYVVEVACYSTHT